MLVITTVMVISSLVTTTVGSLKTIHKTHFSALNRHIKRSQSTQRTNSLAWWNCPLHHQKAMTPRSIKIIWPFPGLTSGPVGVSRKALHYSPNHPGSKDHIESWPRPAGPRRARVQPLLVNTRCSRPAEAPGLWLPQSTACRLGTQYRVIFQNAS